MQKESNTAVPNIICETATHVLQFCPKGLNCTVTYILCCINIEINEYTIVVLVGVILWVLRDAVVPQMSGKIILSENTGCVV